MTADENGDHPAILDWTWFCDEAGDEIAPQVTRLLTEAIIHCMPWTWEPER